VTKLGLGTSTIANLFDLGVSNCKCGKSVQGMLDQNLPIVLVYILTMAAREQETTENLVESIQAQQKRQKIDREKLIKDRTRALEKQQQVANDDDSSTKYLARAHIDRTGAVKKEDQDSGSCWQAVLAIILFIMMPALAIVLIIVCSIITQIAQAAITENATMREFQKVMSWINPAEALADGVVAIVCELGGYNPNDEEMQKLKMGLKIALNVIAAVAMIVAGIVASIFTGGAAAPAVAIAVAGMITGIIQLACAILEYKQAEKELELAENRFIYNKILVLIEQIKMNLEIVTQDLDLLIEMFSSKMSNVREEYEKASRILKEYNDTKRAIAQNIRS
jgi:hypothetical protein